MNFIIYIIVLMVVSLCDAVKFTRCELVHQLRNHGFPEPKMRDWVCLVEAESSRRTDVVGPPNSNGSRDYGLFQINDKYWCSNTTIPGKDCHVTCAELITNDIGKACKCAQKIFKIQGFNAWRGWQKRCQGTLPDISMCGENHIELSSN